MKFIYLFILLLVWFISFWTGYLFNSLTHPSRPAATAAAAAAGEDAVVNVNSLDEVVHVVMLAAARTVRQLDRLTMSVDTTLRSILLHRTGPLHLHVVGGLERTAATAAAANHGTDDGASTSVNGSRLVAEYVDRLNERQMPEFQATFYQFNSDDVIPVGLRPTTLKLFQRYFQAGAHDVRLRKLFVERVLPASLDRVLFLDSDLILLDDVRALWHWCTQRMDGNQSLWWAMASEQGAPYLDYVQKFAHPIPGLPNQGWGLNSGLAMVYLSRLRRAGYLSPFLHQLLHDWHQDPPQHQLGYGDQDVFNYYYREHPDRFLLLPCSWNLQLTQANSWMSLPCLGQRIHVVHGNTQFFKDAVGPFSALHFGGVRLGLSQTLTDYYAMGSRDADDVQELANSVLDYSPTQHQGHWQYGFHQWHGQQPTEQGYPFGLQQRLRPRHQLHGQPLHWFQPFPVWAQSFRVTKGREQSHRLDFSQLPEFVQWSSHYIVHKYHSRTAGQHLEPCDK